MTLKSYSELILLETFLERFHYLKLGGLVGKETFGSDRYLNQALYESKEWRKCRNEIIIRDYGCDLACDGFDLHTRLLVHHINPITVEDILDRNWKVFDPDNLILTSHDTHQAIHYGDESLLIVAPIERRPNDTSPWLKV